MKLKPRSLSLPSSPCPFPAGVLPPPASACSLVSHACVLLSSVFSSSAPPRKNPHCSLVFHHFCGSSSQMHKDTWKECKTTEVPQAQNRSGWDLGVCLGVSGTGGPWSPPLEELRVADPRIGWT